MKDSIGIRGSWPWYLSFILFVIPIDGLLGQKRSVIKEWPPVNKSILLEIDDLMDGTFMSFNYFPLDDKSSVLYFSMITDPYKLYKYLIEDFALTDPRNNYKLNIEDYVGVVEKEIQVHTQGTDGISGGINGYHVLQEDSIFVFGRGASQYTLIDENAKVLDKFSCNSWLDENTFNGHPVFFGSVTSYAKGDLLVSSTNGSPFFDVHSVGSIVDLGNNTCYPILKLDKYLKKWYGDYNANLIHYFCADSDYIYAAPASSHFVYMLDSQFNIVSRVKMSLSTLGKFKAISAKKTDVPQIQQERHLAQQGFYHELIYDKYHSRFYRRAYDKNLDFKIKEDSWKFPYLLVFDDGLIKTHEMNIPEQYSHFKAFTSDLGLCLFNQAASDTTEMALIFDCFLFDR